jgi:transposase
MRKKTKFKTSTIKNMKFIDSETLYERFINPKSALIKIHDQIDFSFVNDLCEDVYCDEGQHAFLPELVFRVSFIQFFKGGLSDNEVVRQCATNMEYRYFCNLAIDDELFDDCKLSRFKAELGAERFKQIFDMLVQKIKDAGFVSDSDVQYLDSFLFLADVKIVSVNALLSKTIQETMRTLGTKDSEVDSDMKKRDFELSEEEQKRRFVFLVKKAQELMACARKKKTLTLEQQKAIALLARIVKERAEISEEGIRKKESNEEKDKIVSMSDPDARMMGKDTQSIIPSYKSHNAMNARGFITATDASLSTIYDGHFGISIVHDLKSRNFDVPMTVGDTHYGDISFREAMKSEGTQAAAPYRKNQALNSCLTEQVMIEAWAYNHTPEYKEHRRIRSRIEPKQGEMKNLHGMKRAKFRGLEKVRIQNYMSAFVTNCKLFVAS